MKQSNILIVGCMIKVNTIVHTNCIQSGVWNLNLNEPHNCTHQICTFVCMK